MQHDKQPDPEPLHADCPEFLSYARAERLLPPGEDPREFRKLWDQLYAAWQPYGVTEWIYFNRIAKARWSFARLDMMECLLFAKIGRTAWLKEFLTLEQALGKDLRHLRASVNRLEKMRVMKERSLASAERQLKKLQTDRKRRQKTAGAEPKPKPGPELADLEPGSNLIQ